MEIVIRGGMFDSQKSESEEVFKFNCKIPFFNNFDPRSVTAGNRNEQERDYTYIIRTTEEGFDYGIQFLNDEYGPRKPAVAIFLRAGWFVPNKGAVLKEKLNEMAKKTLCAIETYVKGYGNEFPQDPFQNPLKDINLREIENDCDFRKIEKIEVSDNLSDKRIYLTGEISGRDFFENPYQKEHISRKGVVWSAWRVTSTTFPNDIVKSAKIKRNYLYKSDGKDNKPYSLKLSMENVVVKYEDPIMGKVYKYNDEISDRGDSCYLKYENGRFVSQKTAEEANVPFNYEIKLFCTLLGEYNRKEITSHQARDGKLRVEYREIPKKIKLSFSETTETKEIEITENDIKQGKKWVEMKAAEEELVIRLSGKGFKTNVKIKVDKASPAYDSLKKISYEGRTIKVPRKNPVVKFLKEYKTLWLVLLGLFTLGVVIYYLYKFAFEEKQEILSPNNNQTEITTIPAENKIDKDKTYFSQNNIWSYASLQSSEGRRFYDAVLAWDLDKIKNDSIFRRCGDNKTLNNAVSKGDDPEIKDKIVDYLKSKTSKIDLNELSEKIDELINQAANTTSVGDAETENP